MFDCKKVKWVINSFKPHKPLNSRPNISGSVSLKRYKNAMHGAWREVKVVFVPKAGIKYQKPEQFKSNRQTKISLTTLILKAIEKLIDLHYQPPSGNHCI
jgi:hypothetical protein